MVVLCLAVACGDGDVLSWPLAALLQPVVAVAGRLDSSGSSMDSSGRSMGG